MFKENCCRNDFSDLQFTEEFKNRPDDCFPCVVTNRMGVGRRLYIMTSADARSGTVRRQAGVFGARSGIGRCNYIRIKQMSMCNDVNIKIIIRHHACTGCQKKPNNN